jgi:hypothetical protein
VRLKVSTNGSLIVEALAGDFERPEQKSSSVMKNRWTFGRAVATMEGLRLSKSLSGGGDSSKDAVTSPDETITVIHC